MKKYLIAFFLLLPVSVFGFSFADYASVLRQVVVKDAAINGYTVNGVDYSLLGSMALLAQSPWNRTLKALSDFDPAGLQGDEGVSFWVNVYNIGAMKLIIDHWPVDSIRSFKIHWLRAPWGKNVITVGGKQYSLGEIEHAILLKKYQEPLIHFGVNCASISCPDLDSEPYVAKTVRDRLRQMGVAFLQDEQRGFRYDAALSTAYVSEIFSFDKTTFPDEAAIRVFIEPLLPESVRAEIAGKTYRIAFLEYNWKINSIRRK